MPVQKKRPKQKKRRTTKHVAATLAAERSKKMMWRKKSQFLCELRFRNRLPEVPLGPRFMDYPFEADRFITYRPVAAELRRSMKIFPDPSLEPRLSLVDPETFTTPPVDKRPPLAAEDRALFRDATGGRDASLSGKRDIEALRPQVSWLRPTNFLSNDLYTSVNKFKSEARVQGEAAEQLRTSLRAHRPDDLVHKINMEFADANDPTQTYQHPKDRNLTAEAVMPIFPDQNCWGYYYTQVQFDQNPDKTGTPVTQQARVANAVLRNVRQSAWESSKIASIYLPKETALPPGDTESGIVPEHVRVADDVFAAAEYELAGDFQLEMNFFSKTGGHPDKLKEEAFVFMVSPGGGEVTFCPLEARVELKRHKKARVQAGERPAAQELTLKRRQQTAEEAERRRQTEEALQPPVQRASSLASVASASSAGASASASQNVSDDEDFGRSSVFVSGVEEDEDL